jgi:acetyl esterase/lipase
MVRNVVSPTLTAFLPERSKANGTAIIICPGGAFRFLSWQNEGTDVAEWLRARGVSAFVLKYRLVDMGATEAEFQKRLDEFFRPKAQDKNKRDANADAVPKLAAEDGRQAIRVVRKRASEWGIDPDRIGILGFSAGGVVTYESALHYDADSRPSFAAPIYGPPSDPFTVPADAPPIFILCADDDRSAATRSANLYAAWTAAGKSAELHVYSKGGHGFGMRKQGLPVDAWIERFGDWLAVQGLLKPAM